MTFYFILFFSLGSCHSSPFNSPLFCRYFKGPELLVDLQDYDYSFYFLFFYVVLPGTISFNRDKYFFLNWIRHSRKPWTKFINVDNQHLAVPEVEILIMSKIILLFSQFLSAIFHTCSFYFLEAVDFVDKLLRYDHQERPTAKEAMVKPST